MILLLTFVAAFVALVVWSGLSDAPARYPPEPDRHHRDFDLRRRH
jgi:hypothetical protein